MVIKTFAVLALLLAPRIDTVVQDVVLVAADKIRRWGDLTQTSESLDHGSGQPTRTGHVLLEEISVTPNVMKTPVVLDHRSGPLEHHIGPWMNPTVA